MASSAVVASRVAQAATMDDVLHSGSWEPFGEIEIYVDPQNLRLVGHALLVLEDLMVEALATQLTNGSVSDDARRYVASRLALVVEDIRVGSLWARVKVYVRKDLTIEVRSALVAIALEAMILAVPTPFEWIRRVDPLPPPTPPAEITACDPRELESIMNRMAQTMPAGGSLSYTYRSPSGKSCVIELKAPPAS